MLHLNHAGASLAPQPVLDAIIDHLQREARIGGYEAADEAAAPWKRTYDVVATLLGAHADEIALVDSATRAWDLAVYSLPIEPQDRVLISRAEYGANAIALLQLQRRTGCQLVLVDDDEHGQIDLASLERELAHDDAALVSLVHVPTQSGLVNPAVEVGRLCREAGVLFVLDACQSAGQLPLDVEELGCAVLTATGRKFLRGPRGTGFLYVRGELVERVEPVMLDLLSATWTAPDAYEVRPDARRFELWERSVAGPARPRCGRRPRPRLGHRGHRRAHHSPRRRPAKPAGRDPRRDGARPWATPGRHHHLHRRRSRPATRSRPGSGLSR